MKSPFTKTIEAKQHSPVYTMHRYFARRPYNVFSELIEHYTCEGDIVLDPFCGGGVTVVEGMLLGRKVIGVDVNPLAAYVTSMEVEPLDIAKFQSELESLAARVDKTMKYLYCTSCPECGASPSLVGTWAKAFVEWFEWHEGTIVRCRYRCSAGHAGEKQPDVADEALASEIDDRFDETVREQNLWYPQQRIPEGDKTHSMLQKGYDHFHQLFTRRNLIALATLRKEILAVEDESIRKFFLFALSGTLKWASRQSHLRGNVVEGWAMHAYWIYPRQLEINVWETFRKRCAAIVRGKKFVQMHNANCRDAETFDELWNDSNILILNRSSASLPIPDRSVDAIITDPPYGGNVNYGELADYWLVWLDGNSSVMDKTHEAVINTTQGKDIRQYEELLSGVFRECHRVLADDGSLVATFNSKDLVIISSFLRAVVRAGFMLAKGGLLYQPPIKAYTTTVHAKEVGAFTGDFIFTFEKSSVDHRQARYVPEECEREVEKIVRTYARKAKTEVQLRMWVYETVIPLLARWAASDEDFVYGIARDAELRLKRLKFQEMNFTEARSVAR